VSFISALCNAFRHPGTIHSGWRRTNRYAVARSGRYGISMATIPLCVPFSRKEEARQAGARWHLGERVWQCDRDLLSSPAYPGLRPFVPRMFRPELSAPFIRP